jgi:sec-independent protein translocase protein TatA
MFGLGPAEVILVLVIALIVFGPGRLPEMGQALGKSIREFREATSGITDELTREMEATERAARGETEPAKQKQPAEDDNS